MRLIITTCAQHFKTISLFFAVQRVKVGVFDEVTVFKGILALLGVLPTKKNKLFLILRQNQITYFGRKVSCFKIILFDLAIIGQAKNV